MSTKFGVIGGGVMGEALLSRLVVQQIYAPREVLVSDPQPQRRDWLTQQYGVQVTDDNQVILSTADVVLLAIKPQVFEAVVSGLTRSRTDQLVVSILAGVPLSKLEAAFPGQPVIRAMPNTPATVGAGMTAIAPGQHATSDHLKTAETLFQAVGEVVQVPESLMDAVTGLSGSGPGYVAILIEALADGGVAAGLPRAIALQLAIQTVRGTAELVQQSNLHPAVLKDQVTSPGGTTIAGIAQLEEHGFRAALIAAVRAAAQRSEELGN
ncbi:MAG: pyrroline-5-carboxylate reductase [Oculatellaceae cyanobacterium bins.114]|nr:pyrroline-5-carboxylate reductase [Oculatellaceae cyanobacterium bins.114]